MARKRVKKDDGGGEGFLATYADTVTLLLTFFILLYSMSSVEEEKLKMVSDALTEQLVGELGPGLSNMNVMVNDASKPKEELLNVVNLFIEKENLKEKIELRVNEKGVVLQVADSLLFDSGKANVKEESLDILEKISKLISTLDNEILIEGHTDNVPVNSEKYETNWELSAARSINVVKYFIENKGMPPERFVAAGYGEYKPLVPNDTSENKSKNRRVDILIVQEEDPVDNNKTTDKKEETTKSEDKSKEDKSKK